jgi:hypothetical protein
MESQNVLIFVYPVEVWDTLVVVRSAAAAGNWFLEATDHNLEGIVFIFGVYLWGIKVSPPIENGQGQVISRGWGPKSTQIKNFHIFHSLA